MSAKSYCMPFLVSALWWRSCSSGWTPVKIAALYDIHGNLPALEAVLAEVDADLVVVGGDVFSGIGTPDVLDLLTEIEIPTRWVMGNGDREDLAENRIPLAHRDLVAAFEPVVAV